jgi:hypothetical protein
MNDRTVAIVEVPLHVRGRRLAVGRHVRQRQERTGVHVLKAKRVFQDLRQHRPALVRVVRHFGLDERNSTGLRDQQQVDGPDWRDAELSPAQVPFLVLIDQLRGPARRQDELEVGGDGALKPLLGERQILSGLPHAAFARLWKKASVPS